MYLINPMNHYFPYSPLIEPVCQGRSLCDCVGVCVFGIVLYDRKPNLLRETACIRKPSVLGNHYHMLFAE